MRNVLAANWTSALVLLLVLACPVPSLAGQSVLVRRDAVDPPVLRTTTGERVEFVNRTGRAVHVEFAGDARGHQVVQLPATGPIWVVFHRPGSHPYVIHVYELKERTLAGVVEVSEDPTHPWDSTTCSVTAMGACIEP
jgi:hypothetical protein